MEKPIPDGSLTIDFIADTRVYGFSDILDWRPGNYGLEIDFETKRVVIMWHQIKSLTVIRNSEEYRMALKKWERENGMID